MIIIIIITMEVDMCGRPHPPIDLNDWGFGCKDVAWEEEQALLSQESRPHYQCQATSILKDSNKV